MSKSDMNDSQVEITHLRLRLSEYINRTTMALLQLEDAQHKLMELKTEVARLDDLCKNLGNQHSDISCENISLRKELADAQENYHLVNSLAAKLQLENAHLRLQVERLRKSSE